MSASAETPNQPLSFNDYLTFERRSTWKHELVGGELHAFAGASDRHNRLAFRIATLLDAALTSPDCRIYISDMKLRVDEQTVYYPDVMVVCNPLDSEDYFKVAPCLIVEVLSQSTAATDRREQLLAYRRIQSLCDYLIVSQEHRHVVHHQRAGEGAWRRFEAGRGEALHLLCPELNLSLDQFYSGIVAARE